MIIDNIKEWFLSHQRDLPWRTNPSPYQIWISEVMLQQTQVSVVIPYFERWMEKFPTLQALASAPLQAVLKEWEGLGYYSRVRNLHEGAQYVVQKFGGELPRTAEELGEIKGVGAYTRGAILSFAFHQKAVAADGNVLRVFSRLDALEEPVDLPQTRKKITARLEALLPDEEPWILSEAFIELGALICKKKPLCHLCPIKGECLAYRQQRQEEFPYRKTKMQTTLLKRVVGIVVCGERFLIRKAEEGKVMAGLYQFPYVEAYPDNMANIESERAQAAFESLLGIALEYRHPLKEQRHTFTRYRVQLYPHLFLAKKEDERYQWEKLADLKKLPFSSGHRRILHSL